MTQSQIVTCIEKNKVKVIQLKDYSDNLLLNLSCTSAQAAVSEFEELIGDFAGYKKIKVLGKSDESTTWAKGFCWGLEFAAAGSTPSMGVIAPSTGVSSNEYIGMFKEMMGQNLQLQTKLMEKTMEINNLDPNKWVGLIQTVAPMVGLKAGGIAGPPMTAEKRTLEFGDVDTMKEEDIEKQFAVIIGSLCKKIPGPDMLKIVIALDNNPKLAEGRVKIIALLNAVAKKPELLDMAMNFIK